MSNYETREAIAALKDSIAILTERKEHYLVAASRDEEEPVQKAALKFAAKVTQDCIDEIRRAADNHSINLWE